MAAHSHLLFWNLGLFLNTALVAQSGGRFEEAKRMGMAYIQSEQFDRAAGRLEEVWEQDKSDPSVGEFLAIAYLNTEDRRSLAENQAKAFEIIHFLTGAGSRVSFLVQHSHERLGWIEGHELNQYCRGRLSIGNHRLTFVSDRGEKVAQHSFDVDFSQVRSVSLNEDDKRGTFHLSLKDAGFFLATRNRNRDEARLIVDLVHQQLVSK
jgi:hypothetical protein